MGPTTKPTRHNRTINQNLGQALATVLTLGLWMPSRIEYRCAKVPTAVGSTDD